MITNVAEAKAFIQRVSQQLLADRAKQEMMFAQWVERAKKLPDSIKAQISFDENATLRTILPELYEERPNPEKYKAQYNAWLEKEKIINDLVAAYNKEAIECLSAAEALYSKTV